MKKLVIADRCGPIVNAAFDGPVLAGTGSDAWVFLYLFAFQIYGDFSGYSDIARGVSRLLGFNLMVNFRTPYLVSNPSAFWRHWHISLSTWIRDYIYIPLGGNKTSSLINSRNLLITMFLGGLWHGAGWAYIFWGVYHGLLLIAHRGITFLTPPLLSSLRIRALAKGTHFVNVFVFFHFTCIGWLLFRAGSLNTSHDQTSFVRRSLVMLFEPGRFESIEPLLRLLVFMFVLVAGTQILSNELERKVEKNAIFGSLLIAFGCGFIMAFGVFNGTEFIYFQF